MCAVTKMTKKAIRELSALKRSHLHYLNSLTNNATPWNAKKGMNARWLSYAIENVSLFHAVYLQSALSKHNHQGQEDLHKTVRNLNVVIMRNVS